MNNTLGKEISLNLLKLLQDKPELTQREMTQKMGVSLGKINYCISALVQKGLIKVEQFKKTKKKSAYMYRLTPKGFEELATLTVSFLKIRIAEYDQIRNEIRSLSEQIKKNDPDFKIDSDLINDLKKNS